MESETLLKMAEPGPMHAHLKPLIGTWQQRIRITPTPGKPAMEANSLTKQTLIFGGRFLQATADVELMGQKGSGLTFIGHNNYTKRYSYYNIASIDTDTTFAEGTYDEKKKTFTFTGTNQDPATGKQRDFRIVITILDENSFKQENFFKDPGKEEYRIVEVLSERQTHPTKED